MAPTPTFFDHRFPRRRGFDSRKIISTAWDDGEQGRSCGTRFWGAHASVPAGMADQARAIQVHGHTDADARNELDHNRVFNLRMPEPGPHAGAFTHHAAQVLQCFGVPREEKSDALWLICHEVEFHDDPELAADSAFIVWHVAGPAKAIDFPNLGFGVVTQLGDALLFDGMQPHGVRLPAFAGKSFRREDDRSPHPHHDASEITVYFSIDVPLTPDLAEKMKICRGLKADFSGISTSVDPSTGAGKITMS